MSSGHLSPTPDYNRPGSFDAFKNKLGVLAGLSGPEALDRGYSAQPNHEEDPNYKSEAISDPLDITEFISAPQSPTDDNAFDGILSEPQFDIIKKKSVALSKSKQRSKSSADNTGVLDRNATEAYLQRHQSALPEFADTLKFEWKDLNVFVGDQKNGTQILFNSNGCIESGQLLAVMGGSGAGKSTLLNALSGRTNLNQQTVTGHMAINGQKFKCSNQKIIKALCTYVPQSDILCPTQTVEEALLFYAKLKLPHLSAEKQKKRINYLIHVLHLDKCRHNFIGSESKRGISGGEKRRVSIASEILNDADIIFLDEPTSGLDAYTAARTIKTLKQFCFVSNKIIISTIHQPSIEVFYLFDQLFLLANGKCCFNSKMSDIDIFFKDSLRPKTNPADVIIFEVQRNPKEYAEEWEDSKMNKYRQEIADMNVEFDKYPSFDKDIEIKKANVCVEYGLLLRRECKQIYRDKRVSLIRIIQVIFFAVVCGALYFDVNDDFDQKLRCHFLMGVMPILFGMVSSLVTFPAQKLLFEREYNSDTYSIFTWALSFILIEIPRELVHMLIFTAICIAMTGLDGDWWAYFFTLFLCSFSGGSFGLFFGTITRTTIEAAQTVPAGFIPLLIFSDGIIPISGGISLFLAYLDPLYYVIRCFYLIEFTGVTYAANLKKQQKDLCRECESLERDLYSAQSEQAKGPPGLNPLATPGPTPSSQVEEYCSSTYSGNQFFNRKGLEGNELVRYWIIIAVICFVLRTASILILWVIQNNGFSYVQTKITQCIKCQRSSSAKTEKKMMGRVLASNSEDADKGSPMGGDDQIQTNLTLSLNIDDVDERSEQMKKLKTRGLESIRRMRKMTVMGDNRYTAKSLFAFTGGYRAYELTFHPGTKLVITIDEEANQGWVFGHYELAPDLDGWFPKSYIEVIGGHGGGHSPVSPTVNTLQAITEEDKGVVPRVDSDFTVATQPSFDL